VNRTALCVLRNYGGNDMLFLRCKRRTTYALCNYWSR